MRRGDDVTLARAAGRGPRRAGRADGRAARRSCACSRRPRPRPASTSQRTRPSAPCAAARPRPRSRARRPLAGAVAVAAAAAVALAARARARVALRLLARPSTCRRRRSPPWAGRASCSRWSSGSCPARRAGSRPRRAPGWIDPARGRAVWTQTYGCRHGRRPDARRARPHHPLRPCHATRRRRAHPAPRLPPGAPRAVDPDRRLPRRRCLRVRGDVGAAGHVRMGAAPTGSRCPVDAAGRRRPRRPGRHGRRAHAPARADRVAPPRRRTGARARWP